MSTNETAVRVLVVGGVANLVLSFALGWVLSIKRGKDPISKHHWLLVAHTVSLQQGVFLLALSWAMTFALLPHAQTIASAWLLVVASVFQDMSGVVNWLRGTGDQFAEKSTGWVLAAINAVLNTTGLVIVTVGVVRGAL